MQWGGESEIDPIKVKESQIADSYNTEKRAGLQRELSQEEKKEFSARRLRLRRERESIAGEFSKAPKYKLARELLKGTK